jgi:3'-5' exoribonuclease
MKRQQSNPLASLSEQNVSRFKGIYFLVGFLVKIDRHNDPYVEIRISDATSTQILYCRDQSCIDGDIQPNMMVHVEARLECAGKRPYFSCKYIGACRQEEFNFRHLQQLPSWLCHNLSSLNRLIGLVASIHLNELQDFVCSVILQHEVALKFITCPATLNNHHTYSGGLLNHSVDVASSFAATKTKNTIQYGLAVAAGLLHCVGVTRVLTSEGNYTDVGLLHGEESLTLEVCEKPLLILQKKNRWAAIQIYQMLACTLASEESTHSASTQLAKQLREHYCDSVLVDRFNAMN